jgi:hypothetical protein
MILHDPDFRRVRREHCRRKAIQSAGFAPLQIANRYAKKRARKGREMRPFRALDGRTRALIPECGYDQLRRRATSRGNGPSWYSSSDMLSIWR